MGYKQMGESGQLIDENRMLRKELKNLQGRKHNGKCEDMRTKNLMRENKALKRQKELLESDFEKMKRYYLERCLKSLISNVVRIKQYRHNNGKVCLKNKVKIEVRGGGEFAINDVQIEELDADDGDDECTKTTKVLFEQIQQDIENDRASWPCGDGAELNEPVSSSDDSGSDVDYKFAGDVDGELLTDSVSVASWCTPSRRTGTSAGTSTRSRAAGGAKIVTGATTTSTMRRSTRRRARSCWALVNAARSMLRDRGVRASTITACGVAGERGGM